MAIYSYGIIINTIHVWLYHTRRAIPYAYTYIGIYRTRIQYKYAYGIEQQYRNRALVEKWQLHVDKS